MKNATVIRFDPGFRLKRHQRSHAPLDPIAEYLATNIIIDGRPLPDELEDLIDQGREDGSWSSLRAVSFVSLAAS